MILPVVTSGMKQLDYLFRAGIDTCNVGSLAKITAMACEREIVSFIGAAMLLGDNMLDMVGQFGILLWQQALLTTIFRPFSNEIARGGIHN
jgi:hypothetical protein